MKKYPSIPSSRKKMDYDLDFIGFDKLDGSNIRAYWTAKAGKFIQYGTRKMPLTPDRPVLGAAIQLIQENYEQELNTIFLEQGYKEVTAFFEFYGATSFAGRHLEGEEKRVTLFDIMVYKKGVVAPAEFVRLFQHLGIPNILLQGRVTDALLRKIETGTLEGMTFEGVVFKGRGGKKGNYPITFKAKNRNWVEQLKLLCGDDEALFRQLL